MVECGVVYLWHQGRRYYTELVKLALKLVWVALDVIKPSQAFINYHSESIFIILTTNSARSGQDTRILGSNC
jgi:hypothetical protein